MRVLLTIISLYLLINLFSCNPINKATQRVLTNESAFNKVGAEFTRLHPCANDSVVKYKADTTETVDTSLILVGSDTSSDAYAPSVGDTYSDGTYMWVYSGNKWNKMDSGFFSTHPGKESIAITPKTLLVTKTRVIHDSAKVVVVDTRALQLSTDSLNSYNLQLQQARAFATTEHSRGNRWLKASILTWVLLAVYLVWKIYRFVVGGGIKSIFTGV